MIFNYFLKNFDILRLVAIYNYFVANMGTTATTNTTTTTHFRQIY